MNNHQYGHDAFMAKSDFVEGVLKVLVVVLRLYAFFVKQFVFVLFLFPNVHKSIDGWMFLVWMIHLSSSGVQYHSFDIHQHDKS